MSRKASLNSADADEGEAGSTCDEMRGGHCKRKCWKKTKENYFQKVWIGNIRKVQKRMRYHHTHPIWRLCPHWIEIIWSTSLATPLPHLWSVIAMETVFPAQVHPRLEDELMAARIGSSLSKLAWTEQDEQSSTLLKLFQRVCSFSCSLYGRLNSLLSTDALKFKP